jgi:hypothetical protein
MSKAEQLYDEDFLRWTEEQAAALRRTKGSNLPLDWENLAEEIEDLGRSVRRELISQIRRILRHLLKLEASPAAGLRAGWRASIHEARAEIDTLLEENPSLRREVDAIIEKQLPAAGRLAADDLSRHGEAVAAVKKKVQERGYTAAQVLGDWLPSHGND